MSARFFLDTNILVYSFDASSPAKQKKARDLIDRALSTRGGLISYQVVQEFLNVALRKFETPLTPHEGRSYLEQVLAPLCEVFPTMRLYQRALDLKNEMNIHFYDALVIASASEAGCKILYTEDLQHDQRVVGLVIQNPFL
jgi:predicted nucleic acid-binding protein